MTLVVTLWWLLFFTSLGLCVGSFLNVVIFRLPLGLDVGRPKWSFCPRCENRIFWYHNIPVVSFLALRGRCHFCWTPIPRRYPIIELMTALVVIAIMDAFFVGQARVGLSHGTNLNWLMADDWPVFVAHIILMSSLLAMSAIDLQFYWVDIRFTYFAAACGIVLHACWTPFHSVGWPRPFDATAVGCVAAFVGLVIMWLLFGRRAVHEDGESTAGESDSSEQCVVDDRELDTSQTPEGSNSRWPVRLPLVLLVGLLISMVADELGATWAPPYWIRTTLVVLFLIIAILWEASHVRESDADIAEAIETEAPSVRNETIKEFGFLLPAIVLGVIGILAANSPAMKEGLHATLNWSPTGHTWRPLYGISTAITGYVIAGGIGWAVRLLANFIYAKEAFATGDIHMLAAAGAVAGWPVVALGFVLTCFLAMVGWVALLPFKRSRVIPLGPWLTLGVLMATLFCRTLMETTVVRELVAATGFLVFGNSQALSG